MAGYDNIKGKGNRFSSTNQPKRRGRKPDIIKKLKGYGCSESDIKRLLEEIVFKDKKGAEDLLRDVELPIIALTYLKGLIKDMNRGKVDVLEKVLDRIYGKAAQRQEVDANVTGTRPVIVFDDTVEPEDGE